MNRSEAIPGVAFGSEADGDARTDADARAAISAELGIPADWATISQVHGTRVAVADRPGHQGEADAILTRRFGLPIAVATADCLPVVIAGSSSIGIAHAGWRGVAAGVVPALVGAMRLEGDEPTIAEIGPHIGPCCYEVGPEVPAAIGGFTEETSTGRPSVDLAAAVSDQLADVPVIVWSTCTVHDERYASYRRDRTERRQVTVAWIR
jgi:YfiH family protein